MRINRIMDQPEKQEIQRTKSEGYKEPAGLLFSGKIKIFDVETGKVLVEQRSE